MTASAVELFVATMTIGGLMCGLVGLTLWWMAGGDDTPEQLEEQR